MRSRADQDLAKKAEPWTRTKRAYRLLSDAFVSHGLEFVVLKGFSHCPRFIDDPRHRRQGDFDLLFREEDVLRARDIAAGLGYKSVSAFELHPLNHLPVMIRKEGWEWRGDYYDPAIPLSLELHFQLWNEQAEQLAARGLDRFWERRKSRELEELRFHALHPVDALGNAALHLLRHLLRGHLQPFHVYELASFLHHHTEDASLWSDWIEWHDESLRALEAIAFSLAQRWFDCRMPQAALQQIEALRASVTRWLDMYSASPLANLFHPNKNEIWLHWSLLDSPARRFQVLRRRLTPQRMPPRIDSTPESHANWITGMRSRARYFRRMVSRAFYHLGSLPSLGWSALRWFSPGAGLGLQFWRFYFAFALFDLGLFIFVLLYNLYLLQLGFHEDFLGLVVSAMTAGSIAGSLLAALAIRRFGLRNTLAACFVSISCIGILRASVTAVPALLALAFVSGILMSFWAVSLSPVVAQVTTEKTRAHGFSFIFSTGIMLGVIGGIAGGQLPGLFSRLHVASSGVSSYRDALFTACLLFLLAVWPLARVKIGEEPRSTNRFHRPSPLLTRFLITIAAWHLGTGLINPFFNVFFARLQMPVEQIGTVFSAAQVAQAAAILAAPIVLKKLGLTTGIAGMQFVSGLTLIALAATTNPMLATLAFAVFMMSQHMTDPGMFTFLMNGVPAAERSNASALNFLVTFTAQAIVSAIAGKMLAHYGYPPVMVAAAIICTLAALLFRFLLPKPIAPPGP